MALLGRWKFTEGTGTTATDLSGNSRTATLRGTATWANGNRFGGGPSLSLPGTDNNCATVEEDATIVALTSISVGGWVRATALTTGSNSVISKQAVTPRGGNYFYDEFILSWQGTGSGGPRWAFGVQTVAGSTSIDAFYNYSLPTGVWQHIFGTFSSADGAKIYVDGVLQTTVAAGNPAAFVTGSKVLIGGNANGFGDLGTNNSQEVWNGLLCDIQLHDTVLTATEVRAVMRAGQNPLGSFRSGPVGPWS